MQHAVMAALHATAPRGRSITVAAALRHAVTFVGVAASLASGVAFAQTVAADAAASAASAATTTAPTAPTASGTPATLATSAASPAPTASTASGASPAAVAVTAAPAPQATRSAVAPAGKNERLQVTDPYIELRTGPGRGFPVFFVTKRGDFIEIELRHTDWYRVRTDDNKVGWVTRQQLESTLTASGGRKSFRDVLLDDYLSRKVQLGAAWGHFHSEPMLKLWTSYRFSETLSLEGTIGQVQGVFSGSDFWHLNLVAEPWSDRRISPFFGVGVGKFKNFPNLSLIGATTTDAKLANAQIGVRYHLTDRFVLQVDYSLYTAFVSDQRSTEYRALTAGVSFFF